MNDEIDPQVAHELSLKARDARERCAKRGFHNAIHRETMDGESIEWFCCECGAPCDHRGTDKR